MPCCLYLIPPPLCEAVGSEREEIALPPPVIDEGDDEADLDSSEVDGRFDASSLDEFRKCYEDLSGAAPSVYNVDLKNAVYLDSSALGMLLVLRDYAGGENAQITISNCSPEFLGVSDRSSN